MSKGRKPRPFRVLTQGVMTIEEDSLGRFAVLTMNKEEYLTRPREIRDLIAKLQRAAEWLEQEKD